MKRTIGIFGVVGSNRGDEAIALSLVAGILEAEPTCRIIIPVKGQPRRWPSQVVTFEIDRKTPLGLLRLIRHISYCDVLLLGGGSLIQDRLGGSRLRGVLGFAWTISAIAALLRKPLIGALIGVDHLHSDKGKSAAREILRRMDRVYVRDGLSKENILEIVDGSEVPVETVCDPVFAWGDTASKKGDKVVLSPAFEGKDDEKIAQIFAGVIQALAECPVSPKEIVLIAMDDRKDEDAGRMHLILDMLPPRTKSRVLVKIPASAEAAKAEITSARAVIAMRLHALIMAYGHTRVLCISRTTKTDALIAERAIAGYRLSEIEGAGEFAANVVKWWKSDDEEGPRHAASQQHLAGLLKGFYAAVVAQR